MNKAPTAADELFNAICQRVPDAMEKHKVPGVALGITCDGAEFMRGFGVTNAAHPLPVNERTLFQIGSITKTFTATAAMRLVEAGTARRDLSGCRLSAAGRLSDWS
ncbi:MAG TPA: serine hydrolase domain-containing protein [Candidatus Binataceae bacterium]|nr:serine hydrolase domain-containing protein [Candidatus Binataceae bacterium]